MYNAGAETHPPEETHGDEERESMDRAVPQRGAGERERAAPSTGISDFPSSIKQDSSSRWPESG
ncbi:hypothetical protein N7462_008323 [Penicillium macrosclerotiorum]|uniref:uncharacterized protein n=1 Tax=Penicillium macrosclerotiorum TaxID=303699 RepID=UPI0025478FCF|nr:uncharacterized protein N7462_008323 [Penicillium macrosclerotiorum]KAJ5675426.1 hypothetical protein N7462_008323 [Penicillium macrosclerotiorum]